MGLTREQVEGHTLYQAGGCEECNHLGYTGRTGIYEFLENSDEIRRLVIANAPSGDIKKVGVRNGMDTLFDDGVRKVLAGITTFDEIKRVTTNADFEELP